MSGKKRQIPRNAGGIEFQALAPVIQDFIRQGLDARKAHEKLKERQGIAMSYRTFARYFKRLLLKTLPATAVSQTRRKPAPGDKKLPLLPDAPRNAPASAKRFQYSATAAQDKDLI